MSEPYAVRFDKRPDYQEPTDLGWIGEDENGVWLKVHPQVAFLEFPELWNPVASYMCGAQELKQEDVATLSAFDHAVKMTLGEATMRVFKRETGNKETEELDE